MLINFYSGNDDWDHNNWRAVRDRVNPDTFKYFCWDSERTDINALGAGGDSYGPNDRNVTGTDRPNSPTHLHQKLTANAEYRLKFGDRAHELLYNQGALSATVTAAAWNARADEIRIALRAESARWGDVHSVTPHHPEGAWARTLDHMNATFFPVRSDILKTQLKNRGLYPLVEAPEFAPYGGSVPVGFLLPITHENPSGTVYYTTNGTDPRDHSGAIAPDALAYGSPLPITSPTLLQSRVRQGTTWSALVTAEFYPPQNLDPLRLTEIMYHPPPHHAFPADELEFLELKNTGSEPIDLTGMRFSAGITFAFTAGTVLQSGEFFVLARNANALSDRYPTLTVHGVYTGNLDNAGERVALCQGTANEVWSATYNDGGGWPILADGLGFSIVPQTNARSLDPDDATYWRASRSPGGSPGEDDPDPDIPGIVINEVLAHTDPPLIDFIELHNPAPTTANIGGWFLTDDRSRPLKYRIPVGTAIPAQSYLVLDEHAFNPTPGSGVSFTLSSEGEEVYLCSTDGTTNLTGYTDGFTFSATANGVSLGRYLTSTGSKHYPALTTLSPGQPNSEPQVGPVVVSQIMYHPFDSGSAAGEKALEYIELCNISSAPVALFDTNGPWRLRDAVRFTFEPGTILLPGSRLLVVGFDPAEVSSTLAFFATYGALSGSPLHGPFLGRLDNTEDCVELVRPGSPNLFGTVSEILVERVSYQDRLPWPPGADGTGASLLRTSATGYGNDPTNWTASADITILTPPQPQDAPLGGTVALTVTAVGSGSLGYQWRRNGTPVPGATSASILLTDLQEADQGFYTVSITDGPETLTSQAVFVGRPRCSLRCSTPRQPVSSRRPGCNLYDPVRGTPSDGLPLATQRSHPHERSYLCSRKRFHYQGGPSHGRREL